MYQSLGTLGIPIRVYPYLFLKDTEMEDQRSLGSFQLLRGPKGTSLGTGKQGKCQRLQGHSLSLTPVLTGRLRIIPFRRERPVRENQDKE